uniref:Rhodanese domain-containing protein n=1 Tax=Timema poppense TaxID=170557 RepID=A0A7R9H026_TIMPO|nr:unnamed protein product [Timema poppensis]
MAEGEVDSWLTIHSLLVLLCRQFQSLFAATCGLPVGLCMWDLYFQKADPFFVFFLALVMIVNARISLILDYPGYIDREQILSMKNDSKQTLVDTLSAMPCALEADDVTDFCSLAQYYDLKTPSSFKETLVDTLFSAAPTGEDTRAASISQALCLPVTAHELVSNAAADQDPATESVRFFLVDCRPADQYNAGHLPTAFHLDCNLMLQEPAAFLTAVQGLLSAQRQALAARSAAGGEHLCFLGSGRVEEDQYTHMVVASFLQKHTHFVSMVSGGYKAIHEYFGKDARASLEDHNPQSCVICSPDSTGEGLDTGRTNSTSVDIFGKISAAMKLKSAEVKGKLFDYIVNPTGSSNTERHVSSSDKLGKRYRSLAPVFSIDDDQEGEPRVKSSERLGKQTKTSGTCKCLDKAGGLRQSQEWQNFGTKTCGCGIHGLEFFDTNSSRFTAQVETFLSKKAKPLKLAVERTGGVLPCPELCSLYPSLSRWQSSVPVACYLVPELCSLYPSLSSWQSSVPVACYLIQNCVPCTLASQVGSRAYRWRVTLSRIVFLVP